jgi:hypothetical protein
MNVNIPPPPAVNMQMAQAYCTPADFTLSPQNFGWDGKVWPPTGYNVPAEVVMSALHERIKQQEADTEVQAMHLVEQANQIKALQEQVEQLMVMIYPEKATG